MTKLKFKVITVGIGAADDPDKMVKVAGDDDRGLLKGIQERSGRR